MAHVASLSIKLIEFLFCALLWGSAKKEIGASLKFLYLNLKENIDIIKILLITPMGYVICMYNISVIFLYYYVSDFGVIFETKSICLISRRAFFAPKKTGKSCEKNVSNRQKSCSIGDPLLLPQSRAKVGSRKNILINLMKKLFFVIFMYKKEKITYK